MKKSHKILSCILCIALIITAIPFVGSTVAKALTYQWFTYTVDGSNATITACKTAASGDITIPASINGYTVTTLGYQAFKGCTGLTGIVIPVTATSIESGCFYNCTSLKNVEIRGTIKNLEYQTFYGCQALESINLPDGMKGIRNYVFYDCKSLKSIEFPSTLTSIGANAFDGCSSLESVEIPDSVWGLSDSAFRDCSNLSNIKFSANMTSIEYAALAGTAITELNLPNTLKSIGNFAFNDCKKLKSIYIPETVTSIGGNILSECDSLETIEVSSDNPNYIAIDNVLFDKAVKNLMNYPAGNKRTSYAIPEGVENIYGGAFNGCLYLKNVTMPDTVTTLQQTAFNFAESIKSIKLSKNLSIIDMYTFYYCSSLEEIVIPKGVSSINVAAFAGCENLVNVDIPSSVTYIGQQAFEYCSSLVSIEIPAGVTQLEGYTFKDCTNLKAVVIPATLTTINYYDFLYCDNIWHIFYGGNKANFDKITVMDYNGNFETATVHYGADSEDFTVINRPTPTCSYGALIQLNCKVCNDEYKVEYGEALGHNHDTVKECEYCGKVGISHKDYVNGKYANGYGWADIDNDGLVSYDDIDLLGKVVCNTQFADGTLKCKAADVNGDGKIDTKDIVRIKKILGIIPGGGTGVYSPLTGIPSYIG